MSSNTDNIDNIPAGVQGNTAPPAAGQAQAAASLTQDIPQTASEVPLTGVQPGENVPFVEQVKGHAKMFAGKVFNNDEEVRQGAERVTGADQTSQQP